MPLKITDVERIVVNLPFTPRQEIITCREVPDWSISEVIRLTTDAGLVGYGETILIYTWGQVTDAAIERVMGKNPADFLGDDTLGPGLQMAIYDVVGKALEAPCYRLLGSKVRDWCPISWWSIDTTPEFYAAEAGEAVEKGYISLKIKHRPWFDIDAQVKAISEAVPRNFKIDSDSNAMLINSANAVPVLTRLAQNEMVAMFESPIHQHDIEGNRQIRRVVPRPIAMHFGSPPFFTAVREEVCDGFVIGGGVASVLKQGTLASEANMPFWLQMVGTGLTSTLAFHLGAVLPGARWPAITCMNLYARDVLKDPIPVVGGYVRVPEAPGLGVEVDEDTLVRYRMEPPYRKPKPRHILAVTWEGGRAMYYANLLPQCWQDFQMGNQPADERGVSMSVWNDDGSAEWADLYERVQKAPVRG
ncbi:MAG: mandelate racemase/muconate lactonizing enzyme family protein [Armatimonadetes bacterium]|nr:mandelate racemase/muconate lactonizing enzyme family protein [Armatimonadota bacterium]